MQGSNLKGVSGKVQRLQLEGVDDKLGRINVRYLFDPYFSFLWSDSFAGSQLRDNLLQWLSLPDPSTNQS